MKKLAVVGATGVVGRTFLKVLEEKKLPIDSYTFFASAHSAGTGLEFMGREYTVEQLSENSFNAGFAYALFSAGSHISQKFAAVAVKEGCVVIDNSSYWRMSDKVPLVVPEVNPEDAFSHEGIIANPNCSTIQAVVALKPIHNRYGVKRVVFSTYQSVSGAGHMGIQDLEAGLKNNDAPKKFPHRIAGNCIPHIDDFCNDGYTKEEIKMIRETQKILHAPNIRITATAVRVPVFVGHSISINAELENGYDLDELIVLLKNSPGIIVQNDNLNNIYPLASLSAGKDEVFVGRIRRDDSVANGLNLWCVADNIRKGAATNGVQILEILLRKD